jgi:hypothetical protein
MRLAQGSGGAVFTVASAAEIDAAATAHRARPWKLLDVSFAGGRDILVAGRPQFIYPGQPLTVVGRGLLTEPHAVLRVARGEERREITVRFEQTVASELASHLFGQVAVSQLEDLGAEVEDVSVAFARHFRVTGQSCSLLMLESEADYARFQIKPEDDAFVVRSTAAAELIHRKLDELSARRGDAKAALTTWLDRLEHTPGVQLQVSAALRLAVERLPREAVDVVIPPLVCEQHDRQDLTKEFVAALGASQLDYDRITAESQRRRQQLGAGDALRSLSSLIEMSPGDPVLARDVAFSALEWDLWGQAYALFRRVAAIRPYEPQTYLALAQCLDELGYADLAMVYYEVAVGGTWSNRVQDFHQIARVEYRRLLHRIASGRVRSHAPEFAQARLATLAEESTLDRADLAVVMTWNTDRTDVDLHVIEPSGEECFYSHPRTESGGFITADVTEGFGPEMYVSGQAPRGTFRLRAHYFRSDENRTQVRSKVLVTVYEKLGDDQRERVSRKTVLLGDAKQVHDLLEIRVK